MPSRLEAFTTEDPTNSQLALALQDYREQVDTAMLDETVPVYDRIHSVVVTQKDEWHPYRSNSGIERMQNAIHSPTLIVNAHSNSGRFHTIGQRLVVGYLDLENPWAIKRLSAVSSYEQEGQLGIAARFATAQFIHHTYEWEHSSYGQSSSRSETSPVIGDASDSEYEVALSGPNGSENFALRLASITDFVHVGFEAIYSALNKHPDERQRAALHVATTMAFSKLVPKPE